VKPLCNGLVGGTVVTCDDHDQVFADGLVAWEDDRITYVGPRATYALTGTEDWLNVGGHFVLPGIVNLHTHTPMTALRGLADDLPAQAWLPRAAQLESTLAAEDRYWSSLCGAWELLRRGVTCIADRGSGMVTSSQALWDSGIRAAVAQTVTDRGGEADWQESDAVVAQWGVNSSRRLFAGLGPHATDTCGDALLVKVRERMEHLGALTFIHVAQSRDEVCAARRRGDAGCVYLLYRLGLLGARTIAAHCLYLQPGEIELLSATRTPVAHCPVSNAKVEGSAALAWELWQAGVPLGLGTDCAACNNSMDPWFELKFAALLHKISAKNPEALPARTALRWVTRAAATCLSMTDEIGVLRVGARADIITLRTDVPNAVPPPNPWSHFVYSASGGDVDTVVVDGRLLVQSGAVLHIDSDRIGYEVNRIRGKLVG